MNEEATDQKQWCEGSYNRITWAVRMAGQRNLTADTDSARGPTEPATRNQHRKKEDKH